MKKRLNYLILSIILLLQASIALGIDKVYLLKVDGAIGPASADFIQRGINEANKQNAKLFILQLDTPGGLDKSMRTIIKAVLASNTPVVSYVAPSGARAASAGTFILYASHIAAMAPGTNLGAASPVSMGGPTSMPDLNKDIDKDKKDSVKSNIEKLNQKVMNDSVAYIKGLAELRKRNANWAEQAVLNAASLTAEQAVDKKVINIVANNINDLLEKLDNYKLTINNQELILDTKKVKIIEIKPDWKYKLLSVITDPSIAYILLLIAVYGIFFEFASPGFVIPGVVGAICLFLALYAFQLLPINYAGLALMILGLIFMVSEAFVPSFGALGIGGIIAFVAGSVLLFDPAVQNMGIAWPIIIGVTITNIIFVFFILGMAIKARQRKVVSGKEEMIGGVGMAVCDFSPIDAINSKGQVLIHGEVWQAKSNSAIKKGESIKVLNITGLVLHIQPHKQSNISKQGEEDG